MKFIQHGCNEKSLPNVENHVLSLHRQPNFAEFCHKKITHSEAKYYNNVRPLAYLSSVFVFYKNPTKEILY